MRPRRVAGCGHIVTGGKLTNCAGNAHMYDCTSCCDEGTKRVENRAAGGVRKTPLSQ